VQPDPRPVQLSTVLALSRTLRAGSAGAAACAAASLTAAARGALPDGRSGRRDGQFRSNKGMLLLTSIEPAPGHHDQLLNLTHTTGLESDRDRDPTQSGFEPMVPPYLIRYGPSLKRLFSPGSAPMSRQILKAPRRSIRASRGSPKFEPVTESSLGGGFRTLGPDLRCSAFSKGAIV
jgi:hypothetical protein